MASCLLSETVSILVVLSMSKAAFSMDQNKYIESVAETANVVPTNVKVLSVDEISTRRMAVRSLLSTSVRVQTSVLLASGQQTAIMDQALLNASLKKNGLPNGVLAVQPASSVVTALTSAPSGNPGSFQAISSLVVQTTSPLGTVVNVTPAPIISGSGFFGVKISTPKPSDSGSAADFNASIGIIVGYSVGLFILFFGSFLGFLYLRRKKHVQKRNPQPGPDLPVDSGQETLKNTGSHLQVRSSMCNVQQNRPQRAAGQRVVDQRAAGQRVVDQRAAGQRVVDLEILEDLEPIGPVPGLKEQVLLSLEEAFANLQLKDKSYYLGAAQCSVYGKDNVKDDEARALFLYSCQWEPREDSLYYLVNAALRNRLYRTFRYFTWRLPITIIWHGIISKFSERWEFFYLFT